MTAADETQDKPGWGDQTHVTVTRTDDTWEADVTDRMQHIAADDHDDVDEETFVSEQARRTVALKEAREVLASHASPFGTAAVDADQLCRVAEYILTGLPATATPQLTMKLDDPAYPAQRWPFVVGITLSLAALAAGAVALWLAV